MLMLEPKPIAKKPAFWAIAIAVAFFVINLTQIGRYGLSWDEPNGMERGRETVALVTGTIWPASGETDYSTDGLHLHPSFYATCDYGVSLALTKWFDWQPIPAGHFLNLLTASAGLVALFYLGQLLFNPVVGLVAEIFMVLFPRFIAHAHFNGKDIPVMVFGTLALLLLNVAARRGQVRYWILAGLGAAAAVTSKLDGLFVLPIFLVPWLVSVLRSDNRLAELRKLGWFLGATAVFIYLLWPELWTNPLHLFYSVASFTGGWMGPVDLPYLGHTYPDNHLPWHYDVMQFIAVTPVILLLVAGAGMAWSLRSLVLRHDSFKHGLLWCWILFPVVPRMLPGITRYDGMRHIFLIVPAVAIMAGLAVEQLLACWRGPGYKLAPIAFCGAIAWSSWQVLECHPYEGFYLNEAVRAVIPGPALADYFDFYAWGTLNTQGVEWVNTHAPFQATVWMGPFSFLLASEGREDLAAVSDTDEADYVFRWWNGEASPRHQGLPAYCLRCYGANIFCIYSGKSK
jgi:Dolichyl-phosphate-mannose-protein mannosyltransferase